jgi:hypothetical protein
LITDQLRHSAEQISPYKFLSLKFSASSKNRQTDGSNSHIYISITNEEHLTHVVLVLVFGCEIQSRMHEKDVNKSGIFFPRSIATAD